VKELIRELTEAYGPSGREDAVRDLIRARIAGHVDAMRVDAMGNLIAEKKGTGGGCRIMLAAHMDELGVVLSHADEKGFLRFAAIGGLNPLALIGSRVVFPDGTYGVIGREAPGSPRDFPEMSKMYIDVGAVDKATLKKHVGDIAGFTRQFVDMGDRLVAKAMDDRVGCAVLVQSLLELGAVANDVYAVFTVQEEVGLRGALTSAFSVEPEVAIALDVTVAGDTPEATPLNMALGNGPAIKVKDHGMIAHGGVKQWMVDTAEKAGIPYQMEVLAGGTADALSLSERLQEKLERFNGNLTRAAAELARDWRTDKALRRLEAVMVAADAERMYLLSGNGDVIEPDEGVIGIGSGGPAAQAAAVALMRHTDLDARRIAEEGLRVAAGICIYTNDVITVEEI